MVVLMSAKTHSTMPWAVAVAPPSSGARQVAPAGAGAAAGAGARKVETLHDAARWGDVAAATKMLEEGADVNGKVRGGGGLATRHPKKPTPNVINLLAVTSLQPPSPPGCVISMPTPHYTTCTTPHNEEAPFCQPCCRPVATRGSFLLAAT